MVRQHMLNWLFGEKDLLKELNRTKKVRINGFKFEIKKVSPLDHLAGSRILLQSFDVLKMGNVKTEQSEKKIREHISEVLLAGVVHPKLTQKEEADGIHIDKLFRDYELVNKVYVEIINFTYGKKKSLLPPFRATT